MLRQREESSERQFFANARQVQSSLRAEHPDFTQLLESLPSLSGSRSIIRTGNETWTSLSVTPNDLPPQLVLAVIEASGARSMRYRLDDQPVLAFGLQLRPGGASTLNEVAYFELVPLEEMENTLESLALILLVGGALTVLVGVGIGLWASGGLLRPLTEISDAATSIAQGRFDTRLEEVRDPDLAALVDSFNEMAAAMENRITRDARFASDVSHELRSPLMTLRASIEVMQHRREELSDRTKQALELLNDEVVRFEHLVQDLLDLSRSDSGPMENDLVNIEELVKATLELTEGQASFEVIGTARGALVMGDKRRLAQVLDNLLRNAEKYGGGATRITIASNGGKIEIAVEDSGPGVAPSEQSLIFERFTRGAAARKRGAGDGAGLGLALVDEHARRHGGSARVEGKLDGGPGARFVITLPRAGRR
jgi:signal transduction histidine kinase